MTVAGSVSWTGGGSHVLLSEILGALSHALDLTEGQPRGHCARACWIAMRVGRRMGLSDAELGDLYYATLLKDLGCSSNAARICEIYLADDIGFKRDFKTVPDSLPGVLGFVFSHTGRGSGLAERFRAILNILRNGGEIARQMIETRCERGADIARNLRFEAPVCDAIRSLDEHWDGAGKPLGLSGAAIPLYSRIALLSQVVDVFHEAAGPRAALAEAVSRSGTWFDPSAVDCLVAEAAEGGFWDALASDDVVDEVMGYEPAGRRLVVDDGYMDDIAQAFAQVIDSKSPYTSGHSERVAVYADMVAEELGLGAEARRALKRAALLHDIGKLGVSTSILDKPGRLDEAEWAAMRRHAELSEEILGRVEAFASMARIGGAHHERLDGKGYPKGLFAEDICLETRIVSVADVFDALTADRPYRKAMTVSEALSLMARDAGTALDASCLEALSRGLERATEKGLPEYGDQERKGASPSSKASTCAVAASIPRAA